MCPTNCRIYFFGPFVVTHFGFSGIKTFFVYMGIMGLSIIPIIFVAYLKNNPLKFGRQTTQKRNTQNKDSRTPMYDHGQDSNLDEAKVVMDLLKSAKGGNADAQTQMGLRCLHGDGVPKDWNKSVEWYNKSARQGNIMALNTLALLYSSGIHQDDVKAIDYLRKAVRQGDANAQALLGVRYDEGNGVRQNYSKAFELYKKAALQENSLAQGQMGNMYNSGRGCHKDPVEAHMWFSLAAFSAEGDIKAKLVSYRDENAKFLSANNLKKAKRLTEIWLKKNQARK